MTVSSTTLHVRQSDGNHKNMNDIKACMGAPKLWAKAGRSISSGMIRWTSFEIVTMHLHLRLTSHSALDTSSTLLMNQGEADKLHDLI